MEAFLVSNQCPPTPYILNPRGKEEGLVPHMKRTEKPSSHLGVKIWDFNLPWGLQDRKSIFLTIQVLFRLMCKEM